MSRRTREREATKGNECVLLVSRISSIRARTYEGGVYGKFDRIGQRHEINKWAMLSQEGWRGRYAGNATTTTTQAKINNAEFNSYSEEASRWLLWLEAEDRGCQEFKEREREREREKQERSKMLPAVTRWSWRCQTPTPFVLRFGCGTVEEGAATESSAMRGGAEKKMLVTEVRSRKGPEKSQKRIAHEITK